MGVCLHNVAGHSVPIQFEVGYHSGEGRPIPTYGDSIALCFNEPIRTPQFWLVFLNPQLCGRSVLLRPRLSTNAHYMLASRSSRCSADSPRNPPLFLPHRTILLPRDHALSRPSCILHTHMLTSLPSSPSVLSPLSAL